MFEYTYECPRGNEGAGVSHPNTATYLKTVEGAFSASKVARVLHARFLGVSAVRMENRTYISVIIPVFNEEQNVPLVHKEIARVFSEMPEYSYEIIFVNDGSHDASWQAISTLAQNDQHVRGLCFSRNFGNPSALEAGLRHAQGDAVVTIDADLEKPPSLIKKMVALWEDGHLVVNAKRNGYNGGAHGQSVLKTATSKLFYWGFNLISDIRLEPGVPDFRLMDRRVVDELLSFREHEYFFRGLIQWSGYETAIVTYDEGDRKFGTTNYSFRKLTDLASTGVTSYSTLPLKVMIPFGISVMVGGVLLLLTMAFLRWGTGTVPFSDQAFLVVFIIANNGIVLTGLGILAMYVLRIHKNVQHKPNYILRQSVNLEH